MTGKKRVVVFIVIVVLIIAALAAIRARRKGSDSIGPLGGIFNQESGQQENQTPIVVTNPPEASVASLTEINSNGVKDMDWSAATGLIVFGKINPSTLYYEVRTMKPDGSQDTCITCGKSGAPQKHSGNPTWSPSGDYIVYTAEREDAPKQADQYAIPGSGLYNDLWAMSADGQRFFRLTDYSQEKVPHGVIHPQFSHSGNKLLWAERVEKGDSFGGGWVLKLADFSAGGQPALSNIQTLAPGSCSNSCFYESHGFTPDDSKIIFSAKTDDQDAYGLDIYTYDLGSRALENLTRTPADWDEHSHISPDGSRIDWMSSTNLGVDWSGVKTGDHFDRLKTELWLMNADGSNKQQLTHFNDAGAKEYLGGKAIVSDSAWGPDGKSLAVLVAYQTPRGKMNSKMFIVRLK